MSEKEIQTIDFGGSYTGEVADGKPHGYGKRTEPNGNEYEGEWENGVPHGHGNAKYYDSRGKYLGRFEGEYDKGAFKHGKWICNGYDYEGDFSDGMPHGFGVKKWDCDLHYYKGEWKEGRCHGKGVRHDHDGIWDGEWKGGHINGNGTYTSHGGWVFIGKAVESGEVNGEGKLIFENGDIYEGEVASYSVGSLSMHGRGIYTYKDGSVYEGKFQYGRRKDEIDAEKKAKKEAETREEEREAEARAKDPAAYDLAKKQSYREYLENKCAVLYGHAADRSKRFEVLKEAYFQAHNSGFNDHMAWEASTGRGDEFQIKFWQNACRLKYEVEALCSIYEDELKEGEKNGG